MDLPLDIKYMVASFDIDVWIKLSYMDDEFKLFSYKEGRKLFIDLFTVITKHNYGTCWKIFGKLHSFDDKPAIIYLNGTQSWCQNDKLHRDNDKPAIIYYNDKKEWWQN